MKQIISIILFAISCISFQPAMAHRMNTAMTTIVIADNKRAEITHRLYVHDLEHSFSVGAVNMNYFSSPAGMVLVKDYVESHFIIENSNNQPIALEFIGNEISGDLIYIYYEADLSNQTILKIDSNILINFSTDQINFLNIHHKGLVKSGAFDNSQGLMEFRID